MANKKLWLVMLVVVLIFGMAVVGCDFENSGILTGSVSITGTAKVGQILTANTSSLGGSGTISFQWKRNGVTSIGTNSSTYVVQAIDEGSTITVTVTRTGNSGSVTSTATATVVSDTALTGSVTITGNAIVGQTLVANVDSLGGSGTISYQWKRGNFSTASGTNIIDATESTYTLVSADESRYITVTVTRTGNSGSVTSESTSAVSPAPDLTGTVSITGTAQVGQTLTVNTSGLGGSGTISYQWKRGNSSTASGTNIIDATESTYILISADEGKYITVTVTRTGNSGSVTSESTSTIASAPALTGTVSISGTAKVGQTLTTDTSSLDGSGTIFYQWRSASGGSFTDIAGANSSTYLLTADDYNKYIVVVVTRSGNSGSVTSLSTSTVADLMEWTQVSQSVLTGTINKIVYANNLLIAVSDSGTSRIAYSTDGSIWNSSSNSAYNKSVAYGNDKWIVVGYSGGMRDPYMVSSTTGQSSWTSVDVSSVFENSTAEFAGETILDIAYGDGRWVAIGESSIGISTDGTNWQKATIPFIFPEYVAYGNNRWIAVGLTSMVTSTDGVNWTPVDISSVFPPGGGQSIQTVAYANNLWIAAGTNGRMATSVDGINWTLVPGNPFGSGTIQSVAYGNNKWMAVGSESSYSGSRIAFSSDGINWTSVANTTFGSSQINSVTYGDGKWIAVGDGGKIAYANDN